MSGNTSAALITSPLWQGADLGKALPDSPHAVSVSLPLWEHVIGYEEKDPAVRDVLQAGYPRFVFNPLVARLFAQCRDRFAGPEEIAFAFPSERSAARCAAFVSEQSGGQVAVHPLGLNGVHAVVFPEAFEEPTKRYWQHFGEIVSSRQAQATFEGRSLAGGDSAAKQTLKSRIAGLFPVPPEAVYLYPSGMAAIAGALRAAQAFSPGLKSVQLGFPYVDILKVQSVRAPGVHFFAKNTEAEIAEIEALAGRERVSAVFCELPGNPRLSSPDLPRLSRTLRKHGIPLIVDDTIATAANVDLLPYADAISTSLTKSFSGEGDVMAGALVLNPASPLYDGLMDALRGSFEDIFWAEDAEVLERNSRDFLARVRQVNTTAEAVCDYLAKHPAVEAVYYPKFETPECYQAVMKPGGGYGCLFSLLLKDAAATAPAFFDRLELCKGPSLGNNFSLACPYMLLAHYDELDWAESLGLSRYLIRVSIGLEPADELIARFGRALSA